MKTAVLFGVALIFFASSMQAEAGFSKLADTLKETLGKLGDMAKKHMPGMSSSSGVEDISQHVATELMKSFKDVKDPKAFEGFVNHLVHAHVNIALKHHQAISKMMADNFHLIGDRHNVVIPPGIKMLDLTEEMGKFIINEFHCYKKTYEKFLVKHGITIDPKTAQKMFEDILKAVVYGKDPVKVMRSVLMKYTKMTSTEAETMEGDFKKQIEQAAAKSKENLRKMLMKHGLTVPDEGLIEMLNHMIQARLVKTMKNPSSVENALKKHFNHAMGFMHRAFGEMDSDSAHEIMERMRAMIPHIFQQRIKEMQIMMKSKGQKMSMAEMMMRIKSETEPEDEDEGRRHHHPRRHHRRHHKMLYVYIFVPIGAIILIGLVSVLIYIYCQPKAKAPRSSVYIEKPPLEKVNPYGNLEGEQKKPASFA